MLRQCARSPLPTCARFIAPQLNLLVRTLHYCLATGGNPAARRAHVAKFTSIFDRNKIPSIPPMATKQPCMYGAKCFRKNAQHLQDYSHPTSAAAAFSTASASTPASDGKPLQSKATSVASGASGAACNVVMPSAPPPLAPPPTPAPVPAGSGLTDLADGQSTEMAGSGKSNYVLKNTGGVYSCSCPAWRNQSVSIDKRTCKHLGALRGADKEASRIGAPAPGASTPTKKRKASAAAASTNDDGSTDVAVLLANSWTPDVNPTGWHVSEKLDGVRSYWNGKTRLSRVGNKFYTPPSFTKDFPQFALDGELWMGRKLFQKCVSVVRRQDAPEAMWQSIKYLVFDAPSHPGTFEQRMDYLRAHFASNPCASIALVEHVTCTGADHLAKELERVEKLGGEGLMLRKAGSLYVGSRSSTLLKVKTFSDAEARVVGYTPGKGKHKGRVGALQVEMPNGTRFDIGTGLTDAQREKPPSIGAIVTYRYQELTDGGVPRFPAYVGERVDVNWGPVVAGPSAGSASAAAAVDASQSSGTECSDDQTSPKAPAKKRARTAKPTK
eukprot:Opistho-2@66308